MQSEKDLKKKSEQSVLLSDNCLKAFKKISSNTVDLVLTDPPYNLGLFMKERDTNMGKLRANHFSSANWDLLNQKDWEENIKEFFRESKRVLKDRGSMLIFMSIIKIETVIKIAEENGFYYKTTGIWHKKNPMPRNMNLHFINSTESWLYLVVGGKTGTFNNENKAIHDHIETSTIGNKEKIYGKHPTQKPIKLINFFIELLSNNGDHILDPFMGSGTTGVSAINLDRRFTGIELDAKYFEIAKKRISNECN